MSELSHPDSINRDYIRLLQVMRRFVKEEFAVSIRMTQDDAIALLLDYAERSRNNVLQEMGKELREFTQGSVTANGSGTPDPQSHVRYYRGAAIIVDDDSPALPETPASMPKKPTQGGTKKVYRGRVISS